MAKEKMIEFTNEELIIRKKEMKKSAYVAGFLALLAFLGMFFMPKKYPELAFIIQVLFLGQLTLNLYNLYQLKKESKSRNVI